MHLFIIFVGCFVNIYHFTRHRIRFIPVTFCKHHGSLVLSSPVRSSLPLYRCRTHRSFPYRLSISRSIFLSLVDKTLSCEPFQCVLKSPKSAHSRSWLCLEILSMKIKNSCLSVGPVSKIHQILETLHLAFRLQLL